MAVKKCLVRDLAGNNTYSALVVVSALLDLMLCCIERICYQVVGFLHETFVVLSALLRACHVPAI